MAAIPHWVETQCPLAVKFMGKSHNWEIEDYRSHYKWINTQLTFIIDSLNVFYPIIKSKNKIFAVSYKNLCHSRIEQIRDNINMILKTTKIKRDKKGRFTGGQYYD